MQNPHVFTATLIWTGQTQSLGLHANARSAQLACFHHCLELADQPPASPEQLDFQGGTGHWEDVTFEITQVDVQDLAGNERTLLHGYHVTDVHTAPTHDGAAFSCTVHRNGKVIGHAENSGTGGCSLIRLDRPYRAAFQQAAEQWANDTGNDFEIEDAFLYALLDCEQNDQIARSNVLIRTHADSEEGIILKGVNLSDPQILAAEPQAHSRWIIGTGWKDIGRG